MKLAQFRIPSEQRQRLGVLVDQTLIDIASLAHSSREFGVNASDWLLEVSSTLEVIERWPDAARELNNLLADARSLASTAFDAASFSQNSIQFLPAVTPSKILAIGRNYLDHAIEGGAELPPAPLIFTKLPNSLSAHNAPIVLPTISSQVDYEAELAVVIGRRARRVSEAEALDYVFGYSLINDVSARDLQFGDGQWVRGKSLDGFAPLGPYITSRDEIPNVHALKIEGVLNGEVMQSSNTEKMIFRVPYLVSYISQGITLEPGDVIATGTPEGVGIFRKPPVLLKAGDVFEVKVEKLGSLLNTVTGPID